MKFVFAGLMPSPKRILKRNAVPSRNLPESSIQRTSVSMETRRKRNERYANRTRCKEESLAAGVIDVEDHEVAVDPVNNVSEATHNDSCQVSVDEFMEASTSNESEIVEEFVPRNESIPTLEDMQHEIENLKLELRGKNEEIEMLKSELEKFKSKVPNCDQSVQVATIFDKCNIIRNITNDRELSIYCYRN